MVEKAKETPSVTKPMTTNGDARTVHPKGGNASYEKGYDRVHPFTKTGYSKVGSKSKSGGDGKERVREGKVNYETGYTKDQNQKKGYDSVGTCSKQGCDDARKSAPKSKSPWKK